VISLPDGHLPPGFVPSPSVPATSLPPRASSGGIYNLGSGIGSGSGSGTPVIPGGFPPMGEQYMSLSTRRSFRDLDPTATTTTPTLIPTQPSMTRPVIPPPSSEYRFSDADSDYDGGRDGASSASSRSSSSSGNTLSTPPPRKHRLKLREGEREGKKEGKRSGGNGAGRKMRSTPLYASAPIPPGIVYPQGIESEGIPVPPPVARSIGAGGGGSGSGTPRSGYGRELGGGGGIYAMTPRASPHPPLTHTPGTSSSSKNSLRTSKSHKHFDKEGYLDPAILASSSAEDVSTSEVVGRSRR
jgi:hypothetical protein